MDITALWAAINGMSASIGNPLRFLDYDLTFHKAVAQSAYMISTQGFDTRCLRFTTVVADAHARLASGWLAAAPA